MSDPHHNTGRYMNGLYDCLLTVYSFIIQYASKNNKSIKWRKHSKKESLAKKAR
jgi:hypothetical protein